LRQRSEVTGKRKLLTYPDSDLYENSIKIDRCPVFRACNRLRSGLAQHDTTHVKLTENEKETLAAMKDFKARASLEAKKKKAEMGVRKMTPITSHSRFSWDYSFTELDWGCLANCNAMNSTM
jgi:formate-dependent nitrite reductase cytochrome c552 subunit